MSGIIEVLIIIVQNLLVNLLILGVKKCLKLLKDQIIFVNDKRMKDNLAQSNHF